MEADKRERILPEAVRTLVEARTGDAVYVVGSDYTIVHWDRRMESLSRMLSEEVLGKPCYEAVMGEGENDRPLRWESSKRPISVRHSPLAGALWPILARKMAYPAHGGTDLLY